MIKGTIKEIKEKQSGTSQAGKDWVKQTFVVSNNEGYEGREQIFAFELFGAEKVENFNKYNKVGQQVEVKFNIKCNEWQGKYYTTLEAWNVFSVNEQVTEQVTEQENDLPF